MNGSREREENLTQSSNGKLLRLYWALVAVLTPPPTEPGNQQEAKRSETVQSQPN